MTIGSTITLNGETYTVTLEGGSYSYVDLAVATGDAATGLTFGNSGELDISSGALSEGNTFSGAPAILNVAPGGYSYMDTIIGPATAYIDGTAWDILAKGPGIVYVDAGGAVYSGQFVSSSEIIEPGGNDYSSTISGAAQAVEGTATAATIEKGGGQAAAAGGIAYNSVVESGGRLNGNAGGTFVAPLLETAASATLYSGSTLNGATLNDGTITAEAGSTIEGTITFGSLGGILDDSTSGNLIIDGFKTAAPGADLINLSGTSFSSELITLGSDGILTLGTIKETFVSGAGIVLNIASTSSGIEITENAPCFAAGTRILTPSGEIPVENLAVGDTVITNSGDDAPIIWIGKRTINLSRHPHPEKVRPILIAEDAIAEGVPSRNLLLSPDHALHIDGALVPAKILINDVNIRQLTRASVTYYHIELAEHSIIFAENTAVETYLETGNRGAFENATNALTLHPDFAQTLREQKSCAPFTETGPLVEKARMRIRQRISQTTPNRRQAN